ncbi:hypothetical protein [Chondromyces crocatus]|uniref:Uncharacterized protein n=1 Tax=Chondromyces crocatus TaxID=52 RepID=A0A0K1ETB6_CHOCO|nr:hypothetical protein [Chondromyces crocatus]AKT44160.1 uncharacterized protein CMC5_084000 [Chondromyces crocatus]
MKATRWIGSWALAMALLGGAAGCGGSAQKSGAAFSGSADMGSAPVAAEVPMNGAPAPVPAGVPPLEPSSEDVPGRSLGSVEGGVARQRPRPESVDRPGLATQWGETRHSRITTVSFTRAEPTNPFAMTSLFYNDEEGAQAMASAAGFRRLAPQAFTLGGGAVAIGLRGEGGQFLSGFVAGEKTFAMGQQGQRYSIVLRNLTPNRIECVVSVDGLDVLDGQPAAFSKRGYLLDPHSEVEIDGFRQSMDTVAAFRFGSVRGSYANQKHGDTRNVGVIGVALFHERGTTPWNAGELQRRQDANPFPGQFATPPGR